jgi:glycogen debranching enzyme
MADRVPQLLRSTIQHDNAFLTLDMMNPDVYRDGKLLLPRGSVHLFRSKFLWQDVCHDKLRIANFCSYPVETSISLDFAADYADIFQVRGTKRARTGELLPTVVEEDCVVLSYQGLDERLRRTRLRFSPTPLRITRSSVRFAVTLEPKKRLQ